MKTKKLKALFLITLILTLPLYSAAVYGDFRIISATGDDGVGKTSDTGFRKPADTTRIIISSDTTDVRLEDDPNTPLACITNNGSVSCEFREESVLDTSSENYRFYMLDSQHNPIGSKITATLYIDDKPPKFSQFEVSHTNNITARFRVNDEGTTSDLCAGVKEIIFYDNSLPVGVYNVTYTLGQSTCSETISEFIYPMPSIDGTHEFYAEAKDKLGNIISSVIRTLYIDSTAPIVSETHLERGNAPLEYISTTAIPSVVVSAAISDYNMSLTGSVYADLSKLNINPAISQTYRQVPFTCLKDGQTDYICKSSPITVLMSSSSADIKITTTDKKGNTGVDNYTINLISDTTTPTAAVRTSLCSADKCYISNGNNIIQAVINKEGAGFNSKLVFIRAPTLGINTATQVDSCERTTSAWICRKNINLSLPLQNSSTHSIYVVNPSQDDIGNLVTPIAGEVTFDNIGPMLFEPPVFKKTDSDVNYIQTGDLLEINLYVKESASGVNNAYADLKEVVTGGAWTIGSCGIDSSRGEDVYLCIWGPVKVKETFVKNASVWFNVTDYAGNTNHILGNTKIYGRSNATLDFWKADVKSVDPTFLDRTTSKYVPGKLSVWADVSLTATDSEAEMLNSALKGARCYPTDETNNYLENTIIYPPTPGTQNPHALIVLEFTKTAPLPDYVDSLSFKCVVTTTTAKDNTVYPAEEDEIIISVGVKDYGLDLPKDYESKIKAFKEKLKDKTWIDSLHKYFQMGLKVCNTIKGIINAWNTIGTTLDMIAALFSSYKPTEAIAQVLGIGQSGYSFAFEKVVTSYGVYICGFLDCTLIDKALSGGKAKSGQDYAVKALRLYVASLSADISILQPEKVADTSSNGKYYDPNQLGSNAWEASKKSIIVSGILLCIPGVIYNIEKARQIDCMYVDCAQRWTAAGFNPYTCEQMRANSYCNFVWGNIFHAIPLSGLVDAFGNMVKLFSSSPWAAAGMLFSAVCSLLNTNQAGGVKTICDKTKNFMSMINALAGVINQVKSWTSEGGTKDYCADVLKDEED